MSDISLILEDAFGVDLVTPASFKIINLPRDQQGKPQVRSALNIIVSHVLC